MCNHAATVVAANNARTADDVGVCPVDTGPSHRSHYATTPDAVRAQRYLHTAALQVLNTDPDRLATTIDQCTKQSHAN